MIVKKSTIFAIVVTGFGSLVAQALFIREFLVTFYGNEFTIGIILACWIIAKAAGSGLASVFVNKSRLPFLTYSFAQVLTAMYLPAAVFFIRYSKSLFAVLPGESAGVAAIFAASILIIGPFGIFDGFQFPFGCRIYGLKAYILEAIGFILAGPIFTYIFLTKLNSFQIALLIGLLNLSSAAFLVQKERAGLLKKIAAALFPVLFIANFYVLTSGIPAKLHNFSLAGQWRGQKLITYENSIYGNLAVSQKAEQYTFYSNGIPIINIPTPDIAWTEELAHFGLSSHPDPRKVLLLGGGAGGIINELEKYGLDEIDYAELNPALIGLIKKFPKDITQKELDDRRLSLIITDGGRFIKRSYKKYDVIFINLPLPSTLQVNCYYTKEFFRDAGKRLLPDGRLVLCLPGSLSYLNEELRQLNLCILTTLKDAFTYVNVIPGYNNIYISSASSFNITPELFEKRLRERRITTETLDEFHIRDRLKKYWQSWFIKEMDKTAPVKINRNLAPTGVFYGVSYWNSVFNPELRRAFASLNHLKFRFAIYIVMILTALLLGIKRFFKPDRMGPAASITTTGFAGMSLNLIIIFSYQIFFGYVYHHIALLATAFMLGITAGSWFITNNLGRIRRGFFLFISFELCIILLSLGMGLLLVHLNRIHQFASYPLFYIFSVMTGFLVGAEFPLANKLYRGESSVGKTAGTLYALDLFGAFFAALLVSIIFIPLFGVFKTCLFLAALKSAGLIFYFRPLSGGAARKA